MNNSNRNAERTNNTGADSTHHIPSLRDDASALRRAGKFRDALRVCQLALDTHREVLGGRPDDDVSAWILLDMGIACEELGQYDAALAAKSEAVRIRRRVCECLDDELLARSLITLGITFQNLGRTDDALLQFTEALDIHRHLANGADNDRLAESMCAVGTALALLNRDEEALPHHRDALAMLRRLSGERDSEELSTAMASLSVTLDHLGRDPEEVRSLREESLKMKRRLVGGKDDETLAILICNMGVSMSNEGDFASALQLYTEAYEMVMRLFPNGHRVAAGCLCNIGEVLLKKEETRDEGVKKIDEGLAMCRELVGDSSEHLKCLRKCGTDLVNVGRVEQGKHLLKKADEMKARIAEAAAAAFSTTTAPAQQLGIGMSAGISRSNYPQSTTATDHAETLSVDGGASLPSSSGAGGTVGGAAGGASIALESASAAVAGSSTGS